MKRRQFIAGLGSAVAWPLVAQAQLRPVVGYLGSASEDDVPTPLVAPLVAAFREGLSQLGFVEGQNVAIEYRWAGYHYNRLAELATDLVERHVDVIAVNPPIAAALAAKAATQRIPIVFVTAADPVAAGLVSSINRPGGNITGITFFGGMLGTKNLELVRTLMPSSDVIGFFYNPDNPNGVDVSELQAGAQSLGQQLVLLPAHSDIDLEVAFALIADRKIRAILVAPDALFFARREQLIARAAKIDVAVISDTREFASAGALLSYGASVSDGFQKCGLYVARILKGEKPSDLPVLQPTKFDLVINLKAAKTLSLDIPPTVLARATEVIE